MSADLAWLGLAQAADHIRRRALSSVELTHALIERIERLDPAINAFLRFTPEAALAEAKVAESEIAAGRWRGPITASRTRSRTSSITPGCRRRRIPRS